MDDYPHRLWPEVQRRGEANPGVILVRRLAPTRCASLGSCSWLLTLVRRRLAESRGQSNAMKSLSRFFHALALPRLRMVGQRLSLLLRHPVSTTPDQLLSSSPHTPPFSRRLQARGRPFAPVCMRGGAKREPSNCHSDKTNA